MLFRDLIVCNKDWNESTRLIIIGFLDNGEPQACSNTARAARSLFGDRQVLWFRDCVVMLL